MKQIYIHGDKAYIILRKTPIGKFKIDEHPQNMEWVKMYMNWLGADHVLRDQTHFMFCETIQDVEPEEIKDDTIIQTQQPEIQEDLEPTQVGGEV